MCQGKPCKLRGQFRQSPCKIGIFVHDEHKGLFLGAGKKAFQCSFHGLHWSVFHLFRRKEARKDHGVAQILHIEGCRVRACREEDSGLVLQKVADEGCLAHPAPAVQNSHTKPLPGPQALEPCALLFTTNEHLSSTKKVNRKLLNYNLAISKTDHFRCQEPSHRKGRDKTGAEFHNNCHSFQHPVSSLHAVLPEGRETPRICGLGLSRGAAGALIGQDSLFFVRITH